MCGVNIFSHSLNRNFKRYQLKYISTFKKLSFYKETRSFHMQILHAKYIAKLFIFLYVADGQRKF